MANESDSESCIELVQVDCESVEGSTDNKLTEDDGARWQFLPLEGLRSKVSTWQKILLAWQEETQGSVLFGL